MVDVIKPIGKWTIRLHIHNEDCPFLCFPGNYHGCKHPERYDGSGEIMECKMRICPAWHMTRPNIDQGK